MSNYQTEPMNLPPMPRRYCFSEDGIECFAYEDVIAYATAAAEAARADEREACAKVCEEIAEDGAEWRTVASECASAIRARGTP